MSVSSSATPQLVLLKLTWQQIRPTLANSQDESWTHTAYLALRLADAINRVHSPKEGFSTMDRLPMVYCTAVGCCGVN